eukprot:11402986-Prorocentrum_lima.AAC.1
MHLGGSGASRCNEAWPRFPTRPNGMGCRSLARRRLIRAHVALALHPCFGRAGILLHTVAT